MESMLKSDVTQGQAGRLGGLYVAELLQQPGLRKEIVELAIRANGAEIARELVRLTLPYIEVFNHLKMTTVNVDRALTPEQALSAFISQHGGDHAVQRKVNPKALSSMPRGDGKSPDLYFFKPKGYIQPDQPEKLAREYDVRGLKPDPRALLAYHGQNLMAWYHQYNGNATVYQDAKGNWCFAHVEKGVDDHVWPIIAIDYCAKNWSWNTAGQFAGVCK
jgi:hypothetical protein